MFATNPYVTIAEDKQQLKLYVDDL